MKTIEQLRQELQQAEQDKKLKIEKEKQEQIQQAVSTYRAMRRHENEYEQADNLLGSLVTNLDDEQFQEYARITSEIDAKENEKTHKKKVI